MLGRNIDLDRRLDRAGGSYQDSQVAGLQLGCGVAHRGSACGPKVSTVAKAGQNQKAEHAQAPAGLWPRRICQDHLQFLGLGRSLGFHVVFHSHSVAEKHRPTLDQNRHSALDPGQSASLFHLHGDRGSVGKGQLKVGKVVNLPSPSRRRSGKSRAPGAMRIMPREGPGRSGSVRLLCRRHR